MKIIILGSSSAGNCYVLDNGTEALIIEAGADMGTLKKALDFNFNKVCGCIISHAHKDHSKYLPNLLNLGINCYTNRDVAESFQVSNSPYIKIFDENIIIKIGNFGVYAFPVFHDIPTLGFVIHHNETGQILFMTDTYTCDHRFENLSHIMIEANYDMEIVNERVFKGSITSFHAKRLAKSHMEISKTIRIIKNQDLSNVRNIILLHLSRDNSNAEDFKSRIIRETSILTHIADKGVVIPIDKTPF